MKRKDQILAVIREGETLEYGDFLARLTERFGRVDFNLSGYLVHLRKQGYLTRSGMGQNYIYRRTDKCQQN